MAVSDPIRGNVDTIILKVLYEGDRYGYDMIKAINARSGGQWEIKQPTLYACLKRLEKQGFIKSYWDASESNGGKRKYYTLTETGREVFISYRAEFERTRDLFGSLISDDDAMIPVDDFSDVEEESYDVPKRRPVRTARPRPAPCPEPEPERAATPPPEPEPQPEPEPEPVKADNVPLQEAHASDFVQQSFLDSTAKPEPQPEPAPVRTQDVLTERVVTSAADPREIMERIYASERTGSTSYADSRDKAAYETFEQRSAAVSAPQSAVPAPAQPTAPAPVSQPSSSLVPVDGDSESPARKEYKDVLSDLVERCEARTERVQKSEQAATDAASSDDRRFDGVIRSVAELGNDVTVRDHNDSARAYNRKYYYYSNRLMMTHYTIMCALMFVLGLTMFLTFYAGLGMRMRYDYVLYMFTGLLPIVMFVGAVIVFATDPDKKKRVNVNFRLSIIIRCVIMLQLAVIVYWLNVIWRMPVGFSKAYIPSLIVPLIYALFVPISEMIFIALLRSERYAVE